MMTLTVAHGEVTTKAASSPTSKSTGNTSLWGTPNCLKA